MKDITTTTSNISVIKSNLGRKRTDHHSTTTTNIDTNTNTTTSSSAKSSLTTTTLAAATTTTRKTIALLTILFATVLVLPSLTCTVQASFLQNHYFLQDQSRNRHQYQHQHRNRHRHRQPIEAAGTRREKQYRQSQPIHLSLPSHSHSRSFSSASSQLYFTLASADKVEPSYQNHRSNKNQNNKMNAQLFSSSSVNEHSDNDMDMNVDMNMNMNMNMKAEGSETEDGQGQDQNQSQSQNQNQGITNKVNENENGSDNDNDNDNDEENELSMFTATSELEEDGDQRGEEKGVDSDNGGYTNTNSNSNSNTCTDTGKTKNQTPKPIIHTHYIFLIHGWLGNSLEMAYVEQAIQNAQAEVVAANVKANVKKANTNTNPNTSPTDKSTSTSRRSSVSSQGSDSGCSCGSSSSNRSSSSSNGNGSGRGNGNGNGRIVVHSITSNNGRTSDGIANGGIRVAEEIQNYIKQDFRMYININTNTKSSSTTSASTSTSTSTESDNNSDATTTNRATEHVSISIIGNSLGGLYARYALSCIPQKLEINAVSIMIYYNTFCTTVTPHLGVASNTYVKIPRVLEYVIGNVLLWTGRELFRLDDGGRDGVGDGASSSSSSGSGSGSKSISIAGSFAPLLSQSPSQVESSDSSDLNNGDYDQKQIVGNDNGNSDGNSNDSEMFKDQDQSHHPSNDLIYRMSVDDGFLMPLLAFEKRVAYVNAFGTDFQVPTSTAAFLDDTSTVPHYVLNTNINTGTSTSDTKKNDSSSSSSSFVTAVVTTQTDYNVINAKKDWYKGKTSHLIMSNKLDALGWDKVFIDTRDKIPVPSFSFPSLFGEKKTYKQVWNDFVESKAAKYEKNSSSSEHDERIVAVVESKDLYQLLTSNDRLQFPGGHAVLVANSKNQGYENFTSEGRPVMDKLARDLIQHLLN